MQLEKAALSLEEKLSETQVEILKSQEALKAMKAHKELWDKAK